MTLLPEPPEEIVYDSGRTAWWMRDSVGEYVLVQDVSARRRLRQLGFSKFAQSGNDLSPLETEMLRLQRESNVVFAGPVAGRTVGIHKMAGRRVLVTNSVVPLAGPSSGAYEGLEGVFFPMLGAEQYSRLLLWIHYARRRLLRGEWHPLPALVLVGPPSAGKSYLQFVISKLLGGRIAKPALFMQGATNFNGDLFGAEHLVFEDESARCDSKSRHSIGEKIKELLFCSTVNCHAKNRQGISLEPIWALSMSINSSPENLMVLPPVDEALADKMLILKCEARPRLVPDDRDETEWLTEIAILESPAFARMIDDLEMTTMDPSMLSPRTNVAGWQNPEILREMRDLAPEGKFLSLIDSVLFDKADADSWEGSAEDLALRLRESRFNAQAEKLLSWPTAAGVFLGRLASQNPERFIYCRNAKNRIWTIHAPGMTE